MPLKILKEHKRKTIGEAITLIYFVIRIDKSTTKRHKKQFTFSFITKTRIF